MNRTILLIDDDANLIFTMKIAIERYLDDVSIDLATNADQAISLVQSKSYSVIVSDLSIDDSVGPDSGFELLRRLRQIRSQTKIILLTGQERSEFGIKAHQHGVSSYLSKPVDPHQLSVLIEDSIQHYDIHERCRAYEEEKKASAIQQDLVGNSESIDKLRQQVQFVSTGDIPVLLLGETGTGKSLCAKAIHKLSKRRTHKLIKWQAPGIANDELVKGELFGHKKGSFTGAEEDREGLIEEAHQGTFFIDDLDALSPAVQSLLLTTLQDRTLRKIGENHERRIDFRFVSATNHDPDALIADGKLRNDFYHRIAKKVITIPPLRERLSDIPILCDKIVDLLTSNSDLSIHGIQKDALLKLKNYRWPGNVRELESVIENASLKANFEGRYEIVEDDIELHSTTNKSFRELVQAYKMSLIEESLKKNCGNVTKAASDLGIPRRTIQRNRKAA